jgi:hypothetical protein
MRRTPPAAAALALLLAFPAVAAPRPEAKPARFEIRYALSFLGVGVGDAGLKGERKGDAYELSLDAGLKGLAGFFVEGSGTATSRGRIGRSGPVPSEFRLDTRYSGVPIKVDMRLDAGTVRSVALEPEPPPRPDRVPVAPAHRSGVTDPVGMLAIPVGDAPLAPGLCDRRVAVFDGSSRSDLVLSRGAVVDVAEGPYRGKALDCRVRWVPVSGHRPQRPAVLRMAANDEMRIRLAPVPGAGLLLPLSISVATGWGTARIEATRWGDAERPPGTAE